MTDVLTRPATGQRAIHGLVRSLRYGASLVPVGVLAMADAVLGEEETAARRLRTRPAGSARMFGYGLLTAVLGLASWFLMMLAVLAVMRGPFWGFVEHGPVEPGTWGGPTRAGAWAVHGLIAVPCLAVLLAVLRGIAALHALLVEGSRRWVLPATIVLALGSLAFFWSWLQQL
ncbi:hypothetical protein AB0L64_09935 [Kribbella sp. NPDC051936]|uniref:hypothetical protein n=1 Tax=Kribbella sp. NPDC051936 TaxID=3154946 RepID=UPI00343D8753